jgi:hypothetical protein
MEAENMTTSSNTKPWMSNEYDMPILDNEEMWSQEIIDEVVQDLFNEMDEENNVNKKEKGQ